MRLSRAAAYALHALARLAGQTPGQPLAADLLAAPSGASAILLRRVLRALVTAGLLRSRRGPGGGYRLARPADAVTMLEVVEAVDGPLDGRCPQRGRGSPLDREIERACEGAAGAARGVLGTVRLSDLASAGE